MSSVNRRLTKPVITALLDPSAVNSLIDGTTVNSLIDGTTVNSLIDGATVNSLLTSAGVGAFDKLRVGSVLIQDNSSVSVNVGGAVTGAIVCFNELGNIHTACGVTWSGSVITIRNSSGADQNISYIAVVA